MKNCLQITFALIMYLISIYSRVYPTPYKVLSPLVYADFDSKPTKELEKPVEDKIEAYIRYKFPDRPDIAVAVFKHENGYQLRNGWKEDIVTYNNDGTVDTGIASINSRHNDRCINLKNYKDNIDCAREIYDERIAWGLDGFSAWYSYVYGKYIMFL